MDKKHRKHAAPRKKVPTNAARALTRAEKSAARLLGSAEKQAHKGYPRLLAEIFRFLRPDRLTIMQIKSVPRPKL